MLEFSKKTNQLMQSKYKYQLQDVEEPNLYREIFDYEAIPKIAFNNRLVPICVPDEIWMTDTTFRDGQQSVSPFTPQQIVKLFKLESRMGGPKGLIRQSEFFLYTPKDREALEMCQGQRKGLRAGEGGGREGDRRAGFLQRLPYLQKDAPEPLTGVGKVSGHRQGGTGSRHRAPLPF